MPLAVLNPKLVNRFAQTLRRSKTDAADAVVLAEYSQRMPFTRWQRPQASHLQLRTLGRYIESLVVEQAGLKNRLRTAEQTSTTPRVVLADLRRALASFERRVAKMRREALLLVRAEAALWERFQLLTSVPGIAQVSAIRILSELVLLAPTMSVRQWVASSGLDPAHQQSGTSLHKPTPARRALHACLVSRPLRPAHPSFLSSTAPEAQDRPAGADGGGTQTAARHLRHLQKRNTLRWPTAVSEYPDRGRINRRVKRKRALLGSNHAEG